MVAIKKKSLKINMLANPLALNTIVNILVKCLNEQF